MNVPHRTLISRLMDDLSMRRLSAGWDRLEEGPSGRRHGPLNIGNLRLTAISGLLLLFVLVAVYATGAFFGNLRGAHFFVGFALIPPLALKLTSTGWRFAHYYLGTARYRTAGPPWLLPRLLAPLLVVVTILATLSGVILWAQGTQRGAWSTVHTDSIVVLLGLTLVHLVVHLRRAAVAVRRDNMERTYRWRWGVALLSLALGIGLGLGLARMEPAWHERPRHDHNGAVASPFRFPDPPVRYPG